MGELGPSLVYFLCLVASAFCAYLLLHTWRKSRSRLLFWSALGFVALSVNNLFLVTYPDPIMAALAAGALTLGWLAIGLFFLKFWSRTRDSLFLAFAVAFVLLAANQAVPVLFGVASEDQGYIYLLRLAAFVVIILAVLRKNFGRG